MKITSAQIDSNSKTHKQMSSVGIIVDGNGRWATLQGLPRPAGHSAGCETVKKLIDHVSRKHRNIKCLYLYCFSSENWKRPETEIDHLFALSSQFATEWEQSLITPQDNRTDDETKNRYEVRIVHLGRKGRMPASTCASLAKLEAKTADNNGLTVALCLDYGGREEIVAMAKRIAQKTLAGELSPADITEDVCRDNLWAGDLPFPDYIIRTGGEMRWSNFLLYQAAYAEFYSSPKNFPDITPEDFDSIILDLEKRKRRFGGLPPTVEEESKAIK